MTRHRLTSKQREQLYQQEVAQSRRAGRGDLPICNICDCPIGKGQRWHESHDPLLPHALGGAVTGIAHDRCNLQHNHRIDTPLIAKINRIRQKHNGSWRTPSRRLPGSRSHPFKMKLDSGYAKPVSRRTGEIWRPER